MPTRRRREDELIRLFVSEFEGGLWRDSHLAHPDHHHDGGVDGVATRGDGKTLAIEHTLIEFFIGEREDFVRFKPFLRISEDASLSMPGRIARVDVPRGINQKGQDWGATAAVLHQFLRNHLPQFPLGHSTQTCPGTGNTPRIDLAVEITDVPGFAGGPVLIRRYGDVDVGQTVEKALVDKLPKLVSTTADLRVLMVERNQMKMPERMICDEFDKRRDRFPTLSLVHIWIAETIGYDVMTGDGNQGFVEFTRREGGTTVEDYALQNGRLLWRHPQN